MTTSSANASGGDARFAFVKAHLGTAILQAPLDQLLIQCRELGLPLPRVQNDSRRVGVFHGGVGELFTLPEPQYLPIKTGWEAVADAARRLAARPQSAEPGNPWVEITKAAETAPEHVSVSYTTFVSTKDVARLPAHWDQAERALAALHRLGTRLAAPCKPLLRTLSRPVGMVVGLVPDVPVSMSGPAERAVAARPSTREYYGYGSPPPAEPGEPTLHPQTLQFSAQGPFVRPLGPTRSHVVAALLWLKTALRQGELVELQESAGRRLVLTDLRGMTAEVTGWTVPRGVELLNAAVLVDAIEQKGIEWERAFSTIQMRYADKIVHPKVLWLGSDDVLFRVDFGSPDGLLDWVPVTAAEQALIKRDEDAEEDDDDFGGGRGGGGWPSTTGNRSGGGRW